MSRHDEHEPLTVRETLSQMTVDDMKSLFPLIGVKPLMRKADVTGQLAAVLEDEAKARERYAALDELGRQAVQEATHNPLGVWDRSRFAAKYGKAPQLDVREDRYWSTKPTALRLFFLRRDVLPTDLRATLLRFVPAPAPLTVDATDELPATVRLPGEDEDLELRQRPTERAALLDVRAVLRLIDAGQVKVGEKTRRPSAASLKAVAGVLSEGDFYGEDEADEYEYEPARDLTIRAFAWPVLLQTAGLASGAKLQLTPAGRKATTQPAQEVIRQVWGKWLKTTSFDEFSRVDAIKGQQSKGSLTAAAPRRQAVAAALKECPAGKWCRTDGLFRLLRAADEPLRVARDPWKLYVAEHYYGNLGNSEWEWVEGRYVLALLFEYAATLGLIDVGFVAPQGARIDFGDHWGAVELSCLSRYDGLMYFRINPLGAWCLGLAKSYEPKAAPAERVLKMLPNLDIVATDRRPPPGDVLFLDRFAERRSESVWHLSREKVLAAVEQGLAVAELRDFLTARADAELPQTAAVFLDDLERKAGLLEDLGDARLILCKDAVTAQTLAADRKLRAICQLAGDRQLVFRAADEAAVRRALRELGHVLPPVK